jgi:hypothetical protein
MSLIIRHSHAEGTLIEGTSRGDGSAEILKTVVDPHTGRARAWRWSRNLGSWYVQRSRDAKANPALVDATETALRTAGFAVGVEIDDSYRSTADVEADAVARQANRVNALDGKAARAAAVADTAEVRARELAERMPMGQPILVGHHSESRMRKAYRDIENASRASVSAYRDAQESQAKAAAAAGTTAVRYNPAVIRRRIERLKADLRHWQRTRDGHSRTVHTDAAGVKHLETQDAATGPHRQRALEEIERLEDQIRFWSQKLADAAAAGACIWDASSVVVGDKIRCSWGWATVVKVNAKSVRLQNLSGLLPFDKIQAVMTSDGRRVGVTDGQRIVAPAAAPA